MSKELTTKFREQGFDEEYIRSTLFPKIGMDGYTGDIKFDVNSHSNNIGYQNSLYIVNVRGNGSLSKKFIVKDHLTRVNSVKLYDKHKEGSRTFDRFKRERQVLNMLGGNYAPRLLSSNQKLYRIVMEHYGDGSFDNLLLEAYKAYDAKLNFTEKKEIKKRVMEYTEKVLESLIHMCGKLTNHMPHLTHTYTPPRKPKIRLRRNILKNQLFTITRKCLEGYSKDIINKEIELIDNLINNGKVKEEIDLLVQYLTQKDEFIHNDPRSSNVLYEFNMNSHKDTFPLAEEIRIAFCDFPHARRGTITHDIGVVTNDTYLLLFDTSYDEKYSLFAHGIDKALPLLGYEYVSDRNFENFAKKHFSMASTVGLWEKLANSIEMERNGEDRFKRFLKTHPFEDNLFKSRLTVKHLIDNLNGTDHLVNLRDRIFKKWERYLKENDRQK